MIKGSIPTMALIFCGIEVASAQSLEQRLNAATETWTAQTGEYVPQLVRRQYYKDIAGEIDRTVARQTMGEVSANIIIGAQVVPNPEAERRVVATTEKVTSTLTTVRSVGLWLQAYPSIRVIVRPKPPKEFLLMINDENCPATEAAVYRVPPGTVKIKVWREGRTPCEKTYTAAAGNVYDVKCSF